MKLDDPVDGPPYQRAQPELPAWPQEQILLDLVSELGGESILCTSPGVGQLARAAAQRFPAARVHCHYLDLYRAQLAEMSAIDRPANLSIGCAADFPEQPFDVVALPLSAAGEAELARDFMQQAHERLRPAGLLVVGTDNPRDTWLQQQLHKLFGRVKRHVTSGGAAYLARNKRPLKKIKNFACEFVFRDRARLIRACSRPGVFAHRRVDAGARQLMGLMEVSPGERILDIGCGSGVLTLSAACRAERVSVHAVDSCARAVECTALGARLNGLANITTELNAAGNEAELGSYQLVLANPPYYANFQIAQRFLLAGRSALEPGGRILLVTKLAQWYADHMPAWYDDVQIFETKHYYVISGISPS